MSRVIAREKGGVAISALGSRAVRTIAILVATVLLTGTLEVGAAPASVWHCRNHDLEVSCADGKCTLAEQHTPMDVHVRPGKISVCAYSGCWIGAPAATLVSGRFLTVVGLGLPFSTALDNRADVAVTIDTMARSATVTIGGAFANPATCLPD